MKYVLIVLVLIAGPLGAKELPGWVGYWSENPEWCKRAGETGEQVLDAIGKDGLHSGGTYCEFEEIQIIAEGWA